MSRTDKPQVVQYKNHATSAPELLTLDVNKLETKHTSHVPWIQKEYKECWLVLHSGGAFAKHPAWNTNMHTQKHHHTKHARHMQNFANITQNPSHTANLHTKAYLLSVSGMHTNTIMYCIHNYIFCFIFIYFPHFFLMHPAIINNNNQKMRTDHTPEVLYK